jgi:hypothetical protein
MPRTRALVALLVLLPGLAAAGCGDDDGRSAAPASTEDAGDRDATSSPDAMPAFGNQDGLPEASCAPPHPESRVLWACSERDGASTLGGDVSFEGEVDELADGPWDCLGGWGSGNVPGTTRFRITNGSDHLWVGWTLPAELIAVGDELSVEYRSYLGQHSTYGHLVVWRSDGSLVGWLAKDGLDGLDPPEGVHITRDGDACRYETECGTVELSGLRVAVVSEQAQVPYGASVEVGDYVVQGGDSRLTRSTCLEAWSAGSSIAVYARSRTLVDADAGEP